MSEEATPQTRSPADNVRTEEATSQAGRWRHPSPVPGQATSPTPVATDQSRVGYTTDPAPQVSPQPILPAESEATLSSTEMRTPHQQQTQQAGQVTTIIHIPQHPHHPHHKYQLLHGVVSDSQQQQQIIQHSNTVIQQQQQQSQPQQQPEVTEQTIVDDQQQPQGSEQVNQPEPPTQEHSPYTSVTPVPDPQQVQQAVSPYSAAPQQDVLDHATQAAPVAPPPETQAQTAVPTAVRNSETPTISVQHPSTTVKEVYRSLGESFSPSIYLSVALYFFPLL